MNLATPFCERAADDPDHTALWVAGESYSYGEMSARATRIAGWLARSGIGPGDRVGVLGSGSAWTYAAILASCWSGAAYVPLSPRCPEARLVELLKRADLQALIVDAAGEAQLSAAVVEAGPAARLAPHEGGGGAFCLGPQALRASEVLADCLVVHVEVQFVPFYKDQPLFAELDQLLRHAGFWLHRFLPMHSRVFKPMLINQDIYAGYSQDLWSDAVYVRRFTEFGAMDTEPLEKIALIGHDLYDSIDLASLALLRIDEKEGGQRQERYVAALATALADV